MVAGADHGNSFKRDMGYSEKEFFRLLPSAIAGYTYTIEGSQVSIGDAESDQRLRLTVRTLPDREIGMIRIPRVEVTFAFDNFTEEERLTFMRQFDHSYQRGGG